VQQKRRGWCTIIILLLLSVIQLLRHFFEVRMLQMVNSGRFSCHIVLKYLTTRRKRGILSNNFQEVVNCSSGHVFLSQACEWLFQIHQIDFMHIVAKRLEIET